VIEPVEQKGKRDIPKEKQNPPKGGDRTGGTKADKRTPHGPRSVLDELRMPTIDGEGK
jgi:hypothetical protein